MELCHDMDVRTAEITEPSVGSPASRRLRERAYRRGFTHGVEAVRLALQGMGLAPDQLAALEAVAEAAMELRFSGGRHELFLDEVLERAGVTV